MRKGYYTLMTLGLAGAITLGGAGILSQNISSARSEKIITTVNKNAEPMGRLDNAADSNGQRSEKEVFHKKYGIYLPESAEIKEKTGDSLTILWNGYEFTYHMSEGEEQTEADMGLLDAVMAAIESVQKYGEQDVTGKNIEISLQRNLLTDDESTLLNMDGMENADIVNRKNYGVRYYAVDISGVKLHQYSLRINSVTGEVFGYVDYHDRGPDAEYGQEFEAGELKKMEPEFASLAGEFVKESLCLGEVKEYDFKVGLMETENVCREIFHIICKTKENDVVLVAMDPIEKSVLCFEINPLLP